MNEQIGNAAGQIWRYLHEHGETSSAQLKKQLGLSAELFNQAIGWLAREDKLIFKGKGAARKLAVK